MRILGVFLLGMAMALAGCGFGKNNLPPSGMMMHPGPGVDGPGPGVTVYNPGTSMMPATSQVAFVGPEGMQVQWDVTGPGRFDSETLVAPGRYNFPQGALYRLKLSNVPGRPGVELYPTLEVGPPLPRSEAFLAHNAIPVQFTEEDLDQVLSGNFVTKVIYLPDPEFQELALAGVETLVSTRLDPGVDPIVEADRRGAILGIVRLGNKDLQIPSAGSFQERVIEPMSYQAPIAGGGMPCPPGGPGAACPMGMGGPGPLPSQYIAGMTAPQYGMPSCGTPIGLPGPPHVPLGVPAGLQRHSIVNHTRVSLPEPTRQVRIDVKQSPGMSYPAPANWAMITEKTFGGAGCLRQPVGDCREVVRPYGAPCAPGCAGGCPVPGGAIPAGAIPGGNGGDPGTCNVGP